jgi:hypothetical protein
MRDAIGSLCPKNKVFPVSNGLSFGKDRKNFSRLDLQEHFVTVRRSFHFLRSLSYP